MTKSILLKKATRIEGNAQIKIDIDQGRVETARFEVPDFRGFEKFTQGRRVEFMPGLISRICGLCCASHQAASLEAIENALGATPSPSVVRLRQIIVLGEWIASHALSFFFLTMPDFTGARGGFFELIKTRPEIAREALALRAAGQSIVRILGKRAAHPVSMGPGRMLIPPTGDDLKEIGRLVKEIKDRTLNFIRQGEKAGSNDQAIALPADQPLNHLGYENWLDRGRFKAVDRSGKTMLTFGAEDLTANITEMRTEWSMAKFPYLTVLGFPRGIMMVGPLARSFMAGGLADDPEVAGQDLAGQLLADGRASLESFDVCRLLEILWAANRIEERLGEIDLTDLDGEADLEGDGHGLGVVEAPRGVLVHEYFISRGRLEKVKLVVATQFNNAYINLIIRSLAEQYLEGDRLDPVGERLIGRCVRLFDPCLSCATH